jgi:transglutaminase-like putative cysteine protease
MESIVPQDNYSVSVRMSFTGHGDDVVVRTFLPQDLESQKISGQRIIAEGLNFARYSDVYYERGEWTQRDYKGPGDIRIDYRVYIQPLRFDISPDLALPTSVPERLQDWTRETPVIQVTANEVTDLARELTADSENLVSTMESLYRYVLSLDSKPFKGTTDALTALRLGEASCNGKSRLFVALTRNLGIPSRLVGGLILNTGSKRTSHQWAEVFIGGYWIPFDTLNDHFARLPGNYLRLYTGDEVMFTHSRNIGFDYRFQIQKNVVTNSRLTGFLTGQNWNLYAAVEGLVKSGFNLDNLQFLLVIPFGVMFVVLFKNVIGFTTFGTFLPALMAMAVQETGLGPGLVVFVLVLAFTVLLRIPLEKLGLLHTPKLAIMMLGVVVSLIAISTLSIVFDLQGFSALNSAGLFPIAILTITSERLGLSISEDGYKAAILVLIQTLIVMSACYLIMSSAALQALVLAFPELLLGVLVLNLWMGSWTGIRVMEFYRFRKILFKRKELGHAGS